MTAMQSKRDWRSAAVAVAAGLLAGALATSPASAQYRKDDGRALDANTRVGGTGENDPNVTGRGGVLVTGNQIVTGNVTAGRRFRGPVGYSDPGDFRGFTAGSFSSDRLVRDSAGAPQRGGNDVDTRVPAAFFGDRRVAPTPPGFVSTGGATGGFVAANSAAVSQGRSQLTNPTLDNSVRSNELLLPAMDDANQESVLSASPIYGVRVWRAGESPNDFQNGRGARDRGDRFGADPNSIQGMRDELNRAAGVNAAGQDEGNAAQGQGGGEAGQQGNAAGRQGAGLLQPLNQSIQAPGASPVTATRQPDGGNVAASPLTSDLQSSSLENSLATGQGIRRRLLVAPEKQTPQLAELRRRFERQGGTDDVSAARQFNLERQAQQRKAAATDANGGQEGQARPGFGGGAGPSSRPRQGDATQPAPTEAGPSQPARGAAPQPGATPPADKAAPTDDKPAAAPAAEPPSAQRIDSLATGVSAKGLHDVLQSAEELMGQQKFAAALEKYDVAQQVAPNNALITLGRANAALAASYYRRAETDLRDALGRAPELVVAQFDLRKLVGDERLQVLVKDLKELGQNDPRQARPMLLLAYIAYNTGNEAQAAEYLAAAEKRSGEDDALLKSWRRHWALPKTEPAAEQKPDAKPEPKTEEVAPPPSLEGANK